MKRIYKYCICMTVKVLSLIDSVMGFAQILYPVYIHVISADSGDERLNVR